jgi:hypothetical protein
LLRQPGDFILVQPDVIPQVVCALLHSNCRADQMRVVGRTRRAIITDHYFPTGESVSSRPQSSGGYGIGHNDTPFDPGDLQVVLQACKLSGIDIHLLQFL